MNTGQLHDLSPAPFLGCMEALRRSSGVIVIAGPTGHGKTALAAQLQAVASDAGFPVVLHGDLRTPDSVRELLAAARTRLALGVLRGGESSGALERMEQMARSSLATDVTVITMRLLPRLCAACRVARASSGFERGDGCDACERGYSGKVRVLEVIVVAANSGEPPWSSGSLASDGLRQLASGAICREDYLAFLPDAERFLASGA